MNSKKAALLYVMLSVLTVSVIVFLFLFLSTPGERHNFFYFQMGYSLFCAVVFWGWMIVSLQTKTHKGGTRSSLTGGAVVLYVIASAVIMGIYSGVVNVPAKQSHSYYYATVTVLTFLFVLVVSLGNIFASRDEAATAELEKPREDLKLIADTVEDCRMQAAGLFSSASGEEKKSLEREFNRTVEILKRKVPDRSRMAFVGNIRAEVDALTDLARKGSGGSAAGALRILKNIQNYAERL